MAGWKTSRRVPLKVLLQTALSVRGNCRLMSFILSLKNELNLDARSLGELCYGRTSVLLLSNSRFTQVYNDFLEEHWFI